MNNKFAYIFNEEATVSEDIEIMTDSKSSNRVKAVGTLQTGNQTNRNGRLYITADLAREIVAPRQVELISTGNMCGEAGHPITQDLARQQTIDPKNICVRFLKMWMEGDNVMSKFQGTNNSLGDAFDKDLRDGVLPAFSLRALGSVEEGPKGAVVTNLKMVTYDYVIYPSHPTAYTKGVVSESARVMSGMNIKSNLTRLVDPVRLDANRSLAKAYTNEQILNQMKCIKESGGIDYIKDKSKRYSLLKEAFDITNSASVDLIDIDKISITEAGRGNIVIGIDDYILKELYNSF